MHHHRTAYHRSQLDRAPGRGARLTAAAGRFASGSGDKWWERSAPNMTTVADVQELVDGLAAAGDSLVIVDFFAPWCGACRALYPKLLKLAEAYPDVHILKVNFDESKAMCKTLGVKVLPFFHIYHGAEGRVAAFSCTVAKFERMREALAAYHSPICSLVPPGGLPEFPDVLPRVGWTRSTSSSSVLHPDVALRSVAGAVLPVAEQLLSTAPGSTAAVVAAAVEGAGGMQTQTEAQQTAATAG